MAQVVPHFRKPWQLLVSVCLTRMNLITKELGDLERRYAALHQEIEFEESVYNDHEHRKIHLQKLDMEKNQILSPEREKEVLNASRELADMEDNEEKWTTELNNVIVASRKTEHDDCGNRSVLNRKLDEVLHFVVRDDELLLESTSLYPYSSLEDGESLRAASDRLLNSFGFGENAIFFSNAPIGVMKLRYKENEERGSLYQGAKLFFMKAHIYKMNEQSSDAVQWLTIDELTKCGNEGYIKRILPFVSN